MECPGGLSGSKEHGCSWAPQKHSAGHGGEEDQGMFDPGEWGTSCTTHPCQRQQEVLFLNLSFFT